MTASAITDPTLAALIEDARLLQAIASEAQERALAAQEAVHAHLVESLRPPGAPVPAAPSWPAFPGHPGLITVQEAAVRACRDDDTIRLWAERHGIGRRYGSRWRISVERLTQHLETIRPA
ncbi:hypothetical protein MKK69_30790 [Methylobacterium sp. J-026]|uniref:hypothetical protein n=1 Tax=Methylobacterium sp. J-026 TaxID=2836624 RepID=UPI001FBB0992|nr:hypothetical protein [Methylobacterium sp. J-026]MCJ2138392.1 hypothetical protein [Methylobacterium sp. J-026]